MYNAKMYKTIRHGENSLQYTILPQNDDFRVEGKLTSNSSSSNGTSTSTKPKKGRKRSFFAYLGLLFMCTLIIGAILIPFLVSAECLPNPSHWFIRNKITDGLNISSSSLKSNNKTESTMKAYLDNNQNIDTTDILSTVKSNNIIASDEVFTIPMLNDNKGPDIAIDVSNGFVPTEANLLNNQQENLPRVMMSAAVVPSTTITTTTTTTATTTTTTTTAVPTITTAKIVPSLKPTSAAAITQKVLAAAIAAVDVTTVVPVVVVNSKKPIILPVLAKTNSVIRENGKLVDRPAEPKNWIRSHWPFIDPSTYFQWAGYKSEDSVLLPAILGIALIGMILIITLCLVARNKKTIVATVRKRNRNDVEEPGEDNTTLLTTGNLSDED